MGKLTVGQRVICTLTNPETIDYFGFTERSGTVLRLRNGMIRVELDDTGTQDSEGNNTYLDFPPEQVRSTTQSHVHTVRANPQPPAPPGAEEAAEAHVQKRFAWLRTEEWSHHEESYAPEKGDCRSDFLAGDANGYARAAFERDRASKEIAELRDELESSRIAQNGSAHAYQEEIERLGQVIRNQAARIQDLEKPGFIWTPSFENDALQSQLSEAQRERDELRAKLAAEQGLFRDLSTQHFDALEDNARLRKALEEVLPLASNYRRLKLGFDTDEIKRAQALIQPAEQGGGDE